MIERTREFDDFWNAYPRRVGKIAAQKAYAKARRIASAGEILKGVAAYTAHKPEYADWCHPTTFLTQGRWMDEYAVRVTRAAGADWFDECKVMHGGVCEGQMRHHIRKQLDAGKAQAS